MGVNNLKKLLKKNLDSVEKQIKEFYKKYGEEGRYAEKLTYDEFETEFLIHPEIWDWIQNLVPDDIDDSRCDFRSHYANMQGFEANNYKVKSTVMAFGFDNPFGRSLAHSLISALIQYHYPQTICRKPLETSGEELLEKIKLDFLGGKDADDIIRSIVVQYREKGTRAIKQALKDTFYINSRKHPVWIQEPEWPVINGIPLKYVKQIQDGEKMIYVFEDLKTGDQKSVEQYW